MARKPKDVYRRIELKLQEAQELKAATLKVAEELEELYKERDELEMQKIFEVVKENGLKADDVIAMLSKQADKKLKVETK